MHAYNGSVWQINIVDSTEDDVGGYTSLALDSNNQPNISYSDFINGDLNMQHYNGSVWQINIVDSAGDAGNYSYTSLALDSTNKAYMSYYYETEEINGDLKYANGTIRTNTSTTADGGGGGGGETAAVQPQPPYQLTPLPPAHRQQQLPLLLRHLNAPVLQIVMMACSAMAQSDAQTAPGIPGISPCDTRKQCREDQDQCWDIFELTASIPCKKVYAGQLSVQQDARGYW